MNCLKLLGSCAHRSGSVAGGGAIEIVAEKGCITISINDYYSFKIFHLNQLLLTKFGKNFVILNQ